MINFILTALILYTPAPDVVQTRAQIYDGVQKVYDAIVLPNGDVDYALLNKRTDLQDHLNAFVTYAASVEADTLTEKNERIAFYANTYNVFTLVGVMRAWPVATVRKIRPMFGFFTKDEWQIGGEVLSLNKLEKQHLRDEDPRVHFIINCASASCPVLWHTVFRAENLDEEMDRATAAFINDDRKNSFTNLKWELSMIFKWYREDWGKEKDVIAFIMSHRKDLPKPPLKVKYREYDWDLNGPTEE